MVGILTFHWADDYGAMLQAYALKTAVESMGRQAEIIPYAPVRLRGRYWWLPVTAALRKGRPHYHLMRGKLMQNLSFAPAFWRRKKAMARFRRQYLTGKRPLSRVPFPERYASILVGSDQVWNPEITGGLDDVYLGNFPKGEAAALISYGASFGGSRLPEGFCRQFAESVSKNFAAVSLREDSAVPFAAKLLDRPVPAVLDPVLLLEQGDWRRLACPPAEKGYILIYQTAEDPLLLCSARGLARESGREILQVSYPLRRELLEGVRPCIQGGPAEFVGYVQNAACVLTNSFHGTAFSVLFEKPFFAFRRGKGDARVADLLEKLGLSSRWKGPGESPAPEELWGPVHCAEAGRRLAEERAASKRFLQAALQGGKDR